jgi:hypothetical protein
MCTMKLIGYVVETNYTAYAVWNAKILPSNRNGVFMLYLKYSIS